MAKTTALSKRFEELAVQMQAVEHTKKYEHSEYGISGYRVDTDALLNWKVKVRNLLSMACGPSSEHYSQFVKSEKGRSYRTSFEELTELNAIFLAAKEDYEGGYLNSVRNLVQAEVFDDELEQARELLKGGYKSASAVIAGVVLETTLRQLCTDRGIGTGKLDKMNADIAKAGGYNLLVQKRITALAEIRNKAAHGQPDQFDEKDVSDMIKYIEGFLADHL